MRISLTSTTFQDLPGQILNRANSRFGRPNSLMLKFQFFASQVLNVKNSVFGLPNLMGVTVLTNAVWGQPLVNKGPLGNLEYHPEFLGVFPKIWNLRNFNFITSCLLENFLSLPIPGKILRYPEECCFSPEPAFFWVDTPTRSSILKSQDLADQILNIENSSVGRPNVEYWKFHLCPGLNTGIL